LTASQALDAGTLLIYDTSDSGSTRCRSAAAELIAAQNN